MCFIVFSYKQHPRYRLILAANRDEFYERPTAPANFWDDEPHLLAGRDLKAGGTWMGVTRDGRFTALTNYREPQNIQADAPSRGALVKSYLVGDDPPDTYLRRLASVSDRYNGFNLLAGDANGLHYFSNRGDVVEALEPGLYGLSNHLLNTPWPKVVKGKANLSRLLKDDIDVESLFELLHDTSVAADDALPSTGIGVEWERVLSPVFIKSAVYGTRASTILTIDYDGQVTFLERSYELGETSETRRFQFQQVAASLV